MTGLLARKLNIPRPPDGIFAHIGIPITAIPPNRRGAASEDANAIRFNDVLHPADGTAKNVLSRDDADESGPFNIGSILKGILRGVARREDVAEMLAREDIFEMVARELATQGPSCALPFEDAAKLSL